MHGYMISITYIDKETLKPEVKDAFKSQRHQGITEHCAKIRASRRAKKVGLIEKSNWTRHSPFALTKVYHTETGENRCVIVQRVPNG